MRKAVAKGVCVCCVLAACGDNRATPPSELGPDARISSCGSGIAFADISERSPDFASAPYGGEAGWDHVDKYGSGIALVDLDGDGALDIVHSRAERNQPSLRAPIVYRGIGDGRFEDVLSLPWPQEDNGTFVLAFDSDGDADLDLLIGVAGGTPHFYRNEGDFEFTESTIGIPSAVTYAYAAAAGDVDGDGDLDLYLAQWRADLPEHGPGLAPNVLLLNDGTGAFVDSGLDLACEGRSTLGVGMADLDGDSDLDIYVANDFFEDCLYENRLSEEFGDLRDVASAAGVAQDAMHAMGVAFGDLDGNGALDIVVTDTEQPDPSIGSAVYLNEGPLRYQSRARELELDGLQTLAADWLVSWGVGLEDFDLDGYVDLHMATHVERLELFWQGRGGRFEPVYELIQGLADGDSRGSAYGDIDGDGDLDIVIGRRNAGVQVLQNQQSTRAAWLRVAFEDPAEAIGATVRLKADGIEQMRVIQAGSSYFSTSPPVANFGVCDLASATKLRITTATGRDELITAPEPGLHTIPAR